MAVWEVARPFVVMMVALERHLASLLNSEPIIIFISSCRSSQTSSVSPLSLLESLPRSLTPPSRRVALRRIEPHQTFLVLIPIPIPPPRKKKKNFRQDERTLSKFCLPRLPQLSLLVRQTIPPTILPLLFFLSAALNRALSAGQAGRHTRTEGWLP